MNNLEQLITELGQKIQYIDSERESLFQKLITLKNQQHNQKESLNQLIVDATVKAFQVNRNPKKVCDAYPTWLTIYQPKGLSNFS